jgi:pilus assembly protein CpaF
MSDAVLHQLLTYLEPSEVDEVTINSTEGLWVFSQGKAHRYQPPFSSADAMLSWLYEFSATLKARLDPLLAGNGGALMDGAFRWHCLLPPVASDGPLFSLRKNRFTSLNLADFGDANGELPKIASHFSSRLPLLIAGPTGSGKTSFLAALFRGSEAAQSERIFCLERIQELPKLTPHWIRLAHQEENCDGLGGISLEKLLHETLRLRPDRMIVGEIRSDEASVFIRALHTGHGGIVSTIHAGSIEQITHRFYGDEQWQSAPKILADANTGLVFLERGSPPRIRSFELFRPE